MYLTKFKAKFMIKALHRGVLIMNLAYRASLVSARLNLFKRIQCDK